MGSSTMALLPVPLNWFLINGFCEKIFWLLNACNTLLLTWYAMSIFILTVICYFLYPIKDSLDGFVGELLKIKDFSTTSTTTVTDVVIYEDAHKISNLQEVKRIRMMFVFISSFWLLKTFFRRSGQTKKSFKVVKEA